MDRLSGARGCEDVEALPTGARVVGERPCAVVERPLPWVSCAAVQPTTTTHIDINNTTPRTNPRPTDVRVPLSRAAFRSGLFPVQTSHRVLRPLKTMHSSRVTPATSTQPPTKRHGAAHHRHSPVSLRHHTKHGTSVLNTSRPRSTSDQKRCRSVSSFAGVRPVEYMLYVQFNLAVSDHVARSI